MSIAFLYTNFIAAFCENVIFKKSFQTLQGCAKLPISYHQRITCHFNYWHTLTLLFYVCIGLHSEIVETNFVVSRFSDIRKETTSFLVVPTRNDQERRLYSVVSARNDQKPLILLHSYANVLHLLPVIIAIHF